MKNYRFSAFCKYVVSTMVGVLCFAGVSVGQTTATWTDGNGYVYKLVSQLVSSNTSNNYFEINPSCEGPKSATITVTKDGVNQTVTSVSLFSGKSKPAFVLQSWCGSDPTITINSTNFTANANNICSGWQTRNAYVYFAYDPATQTLYYAGESISIVIGSSIKSALIAPPAGVSSGDMFCNNSYTLTADFDGTNPATGYPTFLWEYSSDGSSWSNATGTNNRETYSATSAGYYRVTVAVDAGDDKKKTSSPFQLKAPAPKITTATNSLTFEHGYNCTSSAQTVAATYDGACSSKTINATITGSDAGSFSLSGGNGSFSVNLAQSATIGNHSATLVLSADGASSVSIPLTGTVPTPTLTLSPSSLSITNENGATPKAETITVTRNNSCAAVTASNSNTTDFEVVKVDDNTFTITYKNNTYDSEASPATGTITFSSAGAISQTLTVEGSVSACSETAVATFEFGTALENSVAGSSVTFATGLSKSTHDYDGSGYTIKSTSHFQNSNNPVGGTGNVFVAKADNDATMFTISGLDPSFVYSISMTAGSNTKRYSGSVTTTFTVGTKTYQVTKNSDESKNISIENCVLPQGTSSLVVKAKTEGSSSGNHVYFDDIVITKLCPPDVKMTVADECTEGAMTFTAQASVMSASTIASYQWYKDGVAISGATSATFTPTTTYAKGSRITVKVTDDLGMTAESKPYVYDCGATIESVSLDATSDFYCAGMTLTANVVASPETGYPIYKWYKDGSEISGATSDTYQPSEAGTYTVRVYADASVYKEASKTLAVVTPTIDAPSVVEYTAEKDGDAQQETITISLENSCSTLVTEITGDYASMYSITDNHNGTYTITFTPNSTKGIYLAILELQSADGAVSKSVTLNGNVLNCVANSLGTFDFSTNSVGSTVSGITLTTSLTNTMTDKNDPRNGAESGTGYKIGSSPWFNYVQSFKGTSGECLQIAYKQNSGTDKVHMFTLSGTVDNTMAYQISFLAGENANWDSPDKVDYYIGNSSESFGSVSKNSSSVISAIVTASDLASGVAIYAKFGNSSAYKMSYYDNIVISSVCPPEVEYSTISGECDVNPSFTAEATKGSADIVKYEWYVITEGTPSLVATHTSSSLTDTYAPGSEIGTGKTVKVVVTDANGLSADTEYEINCGPVIDDITAPDEICPDGDLSLSVPTYISASTVNDEGWEVAASATAARSEWVELESLNDVPETYNNWYIRYFAENNEGRGKSNAVQITMFDAPEVGTISMEDICVGESFVLNNPTVVFSKTDDEQEGWQYKYSTDSDYETLESSTVFYTEGTVNIRYLAFDGCQTTYSYTTADVHEPSIAVTEYPTFMRVAGTQQVVADAPVLTATCVGDLSYSITEGNDNGYFSIDDKGVITMTSAATETGEFPITVKITDGTTTVTKDLTIIITEEPTLMLQCSAQTDYYVYTNYQKINIQNVVTSNFVNDNVTLELTGSAASYFGLSLDEVTKNTPNVPVTIAQSDFFTSAGDYALMLTATVEDLTEECEVNIHSKQISFTENIADQTNCSSDAPALSVTVSGEDAHLPITYQWYNNGVAVSGATNSSFTPTVDGDYYCKVSTGETVLYTTKTANVFFVKNMPVVAFDESENTIPEEVYCSQEIGAVLKVTLNGADVTSNYKQYWWEIGSASDGLTSGNMHTFSFDCASNDNTTTIGAYIMESTSGCIIPVKKSITVKAMNKEYYYYGPTGDESDVTNPSNWYSCVNKANGESVFIYDNNVQYTNYPIADNSETRIEMHEGDIRCFNGNPSNHQYLYLTCSCPHANPSTNVFDGEGCKYIVNTDGVKLKEGQTWTVSGEGSTISVGNGNWSSNLSSVGGTWSKGSPNAGYNNPNSYYEYSSSGVNGKNQLEAYTKIAEHDYRSQAKEFIIEGTLNTYDGIKLDVKTGSTLTIATDNGNFELGTLDPDRLTNQGGDANTFYHTCIKPSSSVTYTGDGAKNIRSGQYGQLYIDADEVAFEENADIKIIQVFKYDRDTDFDNINPNGSTISYIGSVNQDVASMPYHNLELQGATEKTLTGNIDVESSFLIGQGVTCKAGANTININGSGSDALVFEGKKFDCGTSTVNYNSTNETTVASMSYYNLNLGSGDRTLQDKNVIGIAGTFTAGGDESTHYTVTGSTVEFNGDGSVTQTIPAFNFNNLTINSSALEHNTSNSFNDAYYVTLQGDVDVANRLILTKGVLNTNGNVLEVSNTGADAVGQGYYTSTQDAAFIYGDLTRQFPANASSDGQMYYFPIGDKDGYKPFITSQITTTGVSEVTVGLSDGMSGTFSEADGGGTVSTMYSWHLTADDNYVDGRVAVSTSQGLNNANAIAYGTATTGDDFANIYGSTSGNTIMYTQKKGAGYYSLVTRTIQSHKYYFNCSGTTDISDINAWYTQENGGGTVATSFDEPDAEWIIKCGTTISSPLAIMGANSKVTINIPKGESLKINSSAEFITATHEEGTIEIGNTGEMKVDYGFSMSDASISNRTTISNKGRLDLRNADIRLTNSNIINDGMLYSENVNWEMTSPANQGYLTAANDKHTKFINNGTVQMVNANFDVPRGGGGDGNIVHIRNTAGAVWLIDNTNSSGAKHVDFNGCNFAHDDVGHGEIYVDFQCGSSFVVKKSDMKMVYGSAGMTQKIGGEIVVEDGNLFITRYSQTGGNFTLEQSCGAMYLTDTDKSGDGILQLQGGGGGYEVNIAGTMYVMGMVEQGGSGASFNVLDGGTVFIGNIGALMPAYSWQFTINIEDGGTLYYCGNRSAGPDNVGTNNGELFYAGSYYYDSDPVSEKDFKNTGEYNLMFVGEEDCMEQYWEGIPATDKTTLLPIELTMLYAVCNEQGVVELHWQTASETNNEYFTILRSFDGVHFEELDIVWGAGTTTEFHNYEYFDTDDNTGIVYYKLRQTDYDGNTTESKVIAVQTCGPNAQFRITEDQIDIFFNHPEESSFVVITSITGQIFYSKSFRNTEAARIAVPQRKGVYIISVIDSKTITSEKFIK